MYATILAMSAALGANDNLESLTGIVLRNLEDNLPLSSGFARANDIARTNTLTRASFAVQAIDQGQRALPILLANLRSTDIDRSRGSAFVLRQMGPSAVSLANDLAEILKQGNAVSRREALAILSSIGPDARHVLPSITPMLNSDDRRLRLRAAQAVLLIERKQERALPIVLEALRNIDSSDEVLRIALYALRRVSEGNYSKEAEGLLAHQDFEVSFAAADVCLAFDPAHIKARGFMEDLIDDVSVANTHHRIRALVALINCENEISTKEKMMMLLLSAAKAEEVDYYALIALGHVPVKQKERLSAYSKATKNPRPFIRQIAAYMLGAGESGEVEALALLKDLLEDDDLYVRYQSIGAARSIMARLRAGEKTD